MEAVSEFNHPFLFLEIGDSGPQAVQRYYGFFVPADESVGVVISRGRQVMLPVVDLMTDEQAVRETEFRKETGGYKYKKGDRKYFFETIGEVIVAALSQYSAAPEPKSKFLMLSSITRSTNHPFRSLIAPEQVAQKIELLYDGDIPNLGIRKMQEDVLRAAYAKPKTFDYGPIGFVRNS